MFAFFALFLEEGPEARFPGEGLDGLEPITASSVVRTESESLPGHHSTIQVAHCNCVHTVVPFPINTPKSYCEALRLGGRDREYEGDHPDVVVNRFKECASRGPSNDRKDGLSLQDHQTFPHGRVHQAFTACLSAPPGVS